MGDLTEPPDVPASRGFKYEFSQTRTPLLAIRAEIRVLVGDDLGKSADLAITERTF